MSLQSILKPNIYDLFADNITAAGSIISANGIIQGSSGVVTVSAASTLSPVVMNSGIVLVTAGTFPFNLTLPSVASIVAAFPNVPVGSVFSFSVILANDSSVTVAGTPNAVGINLGAGMTSSHTTPIEISQGIILPNPPVANSFINSWYMQKQFFLVLTSLTAAVLY